MTKILGLSCNCVGYVECLKCSPTMLLNLSNLAILRADHCLSYRTCSECSDAVTCYTSVGKCSISPDQCTTKQGFFTFLVCV